jgi:hypothetical protein
MNIVAADALCELSADTYMAIVSELLRHHNFDRPPVG